MAILKKRLEEIIEKMVKKSFNKCSDGAYTIRSDEEQKEIEDYDESDFETWNWP